MPSMLHKFGLEYNPFEPSAAGPPLKGMLSPPTALAERIRAILDAHQTGGGTKALIVTGAYGTGKTCLLRWLHTDESNPSISTIPVYSSTTSPMRCCEPSAARISPSSYGSSPDRPSPLRGTYTGVITSPPYPNRHMTIRGCSASLTSIRPRLEKGRASLARK